MSLKTMKLFSISHISLSMKTTLVWYSCRRPSLHNHDDVINWKHFPGFRPFLKGTTDYGWIPLTKVSDTEFWRFFDMRLNKRMSKQSRYRWSQTPCRSLSRHYNVKRMFKAQPIMWQVWLKLLMKRVRSDPGILLIRWYDFNPNTDK